MRQCDNTIIEPCIREHEYLCGMCVFYSQIRCWEQNLLRFDVVVNHSLLVIG